MKILSSFNPAFKAADRILDFSLMQEFNIDRLYAVINVTRNQPIYIPGAPGLGATAIQGARITLSYDTTAYDDADELNVYYSATDSRNETNMAIETGGNLQKHTELLTRILLELRIQNVMLKEGLNIKDELSRMRFDLNIDQNAVE
jgi:hypothetical protein